MTSRTDVFRGSTPRNNFRGFFLGLFLSTGRYFREFFHTLLFSTDFSTLWFRSLELWFAFLSYKSGAYRKHEAGGEASNGGVARIMPKRRGGLSPERERAYA